ncbi:MAG: hypothetical protein JWP63_1425 [Candidatus Solibacter sp.]|nr:hypothetical protein [Candidatus Solibacter sp.]
MRQVALFTLCCAALWSQDQRSQDQRSQDQPPVAAPPPAGPPVLRSTGKPIIVPFQCSDEDIHSAGLSCSEQDPCPVYLELAELDSTGIRLFAAGNIHTSTATLYSILLGSDDNGVTWREVHDRIRGAGLDHLQFAGTDTGWVSGISLTPLPQDPFLLQTTDGGKSWRPHAIFNEPRFGGIQQFNFDDKTSGALIIDHGPGSEGDRYELYETNDGGDTWNIKQTSVKPLRLKLPPAPPAPEWRVRADAATKSFQLEHRQGQRWTSLAAFAVNLGVCKPE